MTLAGVVLAGGASRRMGRDKALLSFRGRPLVDHAVATLREALRGAPVWVSGRAYAGHESIADLRPDAGPLAGLWSSCEHARREGCSGVLFIPVDMPLLSTPTLQRLAESFVGQPAVAFAGAELPVVVAVTQGVTSVLRELCEREHGAGRSIRALLDVIGAERLPPPADLASTELTNANTPEVWRLLDDAERGTR
nr:molybdopterin guanine dinucleotide synthase [uncultured bacterium]